MVLATTISQRQSLRSKRVNRDRQERAEARMDEIVKVAGISDDYAAADRAGDLEVEAQFARVYQLVDTDAEREAVARAFAVWQKSEQREEAALTGSVTEAVELLKSHNALLIGEGPTFPTSVIRRQQRARA